MELSHESHEHSLFFVDGESNTDQFVFCCACDGDICGARYSCLACNFHLHKSCTELPPRLEEHPFHPQHPLSLLPRSPYKGRYFCDACGQYFYETNFVYHCSLCGFDLHIMCALCLDLKVSIISARNGEKKLFRCGAYQQHLLMLEEEQSTSLPMNSKICFVCEESRSSPFFFCSKSGCNFGLHKSCADLPQQIQINFFHPQHPLFLFFNASEECQICGRLLASQYAYVCTRCDFRIHPRCAFSNSKDVIRSMRKKRYESLHDRFERKFRAVELPEQIQNNYFHPRHPLCLNLEYSGECKVCGEETDQPTYACKQCHFFCHRLCGLGIGNPDILDGLKSTVGADELPQQFENNYFHPEHPLFLDLERRGECIICGQETDQPTYACKPCDFFCHRRCALQNPDFLNGLKSIVEADELPQQIRNNYFHPEHHLFLDLECRGKCKICGLETVQPTYACKECDFFCHRRCALLNPIDIIKRVGKKQFQHSIHDHSLILLQDLREWRSNAGKCGLCHEEVDSFPSYVCHFCNFILHKSCAELPPQIKSHLHPDHFLFSVPKPPPGKSYCDWCSKKISGLNYQCILCWFVLHVHCFLSLQGFEQLYDHKHCFIELKTFHKLSCQTCGEEGYFSPWQCSSCHILVHKKCADLPSILKLVYHEHHLKLTYYLSLVLKFNGMKCELCHRVVNVGSAAYYCSECNYAAHLQCASKVGGDSKLEEVNQDDHPASKESQNSITNSDISNQHELTLIDQDLEYHKYCHELTLIEQDLEDHKYCEGCVRLIFPPFYSCKQCNFYLHKKCAESPRTTRHPFHDHLLTLNVVEDLVWCNECGYWFNGFKYNCQDPRCTFTLDFQCADILSEGLQHPCHEHPLSFPYTREDDKCKGCGEMQKHILVCSECDYCLGYCCLRIPYVAKHRYDNHLLKLTHLKEDESGEYYCDICEEERDPKIWFYSCSQCEFFAHIGCTLGEFPNLKYGMTVKSYSHDHPLSLVEKCQRKTPPLCSTCGKRCYSRVLECCQCNLHFHFNLSCLHSYRSF